MNKYYVLSQKKEANVMSYLRGIKAVLLNNIEELHEEGMNIQSLSDIDKNNHILFLVTSYFKNFQFSIRGFVAETYIVSKDFLKILLSFDVKLEKIYNLKVVNINNTSESLNGEYYLIVFKEYSYQNILNLDLSNFYQEFHETIDGISNIYVKDDIDLDFIIIEEFNSTLKTPICSDSFRQEYINKGLKGVNFFEIEKAPWDDDAISSYFNSLEKDLNTNFVEPI